jgi:small-conductance mechanosensitive channel
MDQTLASNPEQIIYATEMVVTSLVGHYGWMLLAAMLVLFGKNVASNWLGGILFMYGHDFDVDDIVYLGGEKKARIIRQTPTKTVFHIMDTNRKLIVPNTELYNLKIEKPMPAAVENPEETKK